MQRTMEVSSSTSQAILAELPEIQLIGDDRIQEQVVMVWASFLEESGYTSIDAAPAFPGMPQYDLARHTRHVVKNCVALADILSELWDVEVDRECLLAAALTHDASKLVEYTGPAGDKSEIGETFLHAQLAGVRCMEVGLPLDVAYIVALHPFTPPHVHVRPRSVEFVILSWADLAAVDPLFFISGKPTHLEIEKRFFQLD